MRARCLGPALIAAMLPAAAAADGHPLARLADRAAAEMVRVAEGRAVQVDLPEDASGMATPASPDLQALIETRLRGRLEVARSGPRVRLSSVLGRSAARLLLAGRVTAEPGGALVDVLAVSADADPDLLELMSRPRASRGSVSVIASHESTPLAARVLDLAFVDDDRLAVLVQDGVSLYRRDGTSLRRTDHRPIAVKSAARAPAGMIVAEAGAFWVATNMAEGAVLFTTDDGRLQETQRAAALPFAGSPQGARFLAGTNLVEVTVAGLGSGPHLRAVGGESPWAIASDGRLGTPRGWTDARVGSAAALLWPGTWITSSAEPPGAGDALSVTSGGGAPPAVVASFPAPAVVTAIGARGKGDHAFVAAGIAEGSHHRMVLLEVTRARP